MVRPAQGSGSRPHGVFADHLNFRATVTLNVSGRCCYHPLKLRRRKLRVVESIDPAGPNHAASYPCRIISFHAIVEQSISSSSGYTAKGRGAGIMQCRARLRYPYFKRPLGCSSPGRENDDSMAAISASTFCTFRSNAAPSCGHAKFAGCTASKA